MKRILSIAAFALAAWSTLSSQALKPVKPDFDAYVSLLQADGYDVQSYDLSALSDSTYSFMLIVREYENGKMIHDGYERFIYPLRNRNMLSRFSEEDQKTVKPEDMADAARGIYSLGTRLNLGLSPLNDSTLRVSMEIPEIGAAYQQISLRPQAHPKTGTIQHNYSNRPFTAPVFQSGTFIPLMFVGAAWYDPQIEMFRFCGENEITPDLSQEIVSHVPHFYVIGVETKKRTRKIT